MTTFTLKKYEEPTQAEITHSDLGAPNESLTGTTTETPKVIEEQKEIKINVSDSISAIVAKALNKIFANKIEIMESEESPSVTKVISAEEIKLHPIETFKSVNKGDRVFIHNDGFKTAQEEWFLTNIPNKSSQVFYTINSFAKFITEEFNL